MSEMSVAARTLQINYSAAPEPIRRAPRYRPIGVHCPRASEPVWRRASSAVRTGGTTSAKPIWGSSRCAVRSCGPAPTEPIGRCGKGAIWRCCSIPTKAVRRGCSCTGRPAASDAAEPIRRTVSRLGGRFQRERQHSAEHHREGREFHVASNFRYRQYTIGKR